MIFYLKSSRNHNRPPGTNHLTSNIVPHQNNILGVKGRLWKPRAGRESGYDNWLNSDVRPVWTILLHWLRVIILWIWHITEKHFYIDRVAGLNNRQPLYSNPALNVGWIVNIKVSSILFQRWHWILMAFSQLWSVFLEKKLCISESERTNTDRQS